MPTEQGRMGRLSGALCRQWQAGAQVPLSERLRLWRHGFFVEAPFPYRARARPSGLFNSQLARLRRDRDRDGLASLLLSDKLCFFSVMDRWPGAVPRPFGIFDQGRFRPDGRHCAARSTADLLDLCRAQSRVVIKRFRASSGRTARVLAADGAAWRLDGRSVADHSLARLLERLDRCILTEFVEQAAYARAIYPGALNTIRMVSVPDLETGEVCVLGAVHRFATARSGGVDGWRRGGVCAAIDLESGVLGPAASAPERGRVAWHDRHPDSGARIAGACVPAWPAVCARVLDWARGLPFNGIIGWDLAIDRCGAVRAIDADPSPVLDMLQVHGPLLRDERLGWYLDVNGAVPRIAPGAGRP
jgi:hypothetical protein